MGNLENIQHNEKCLRCNEKMILDDRDFMFNGCEDRYFICPKCGKVSLKIKIRYGRICKRIYTNEQGDVIWK